MDELASRLRECASPVPAEQRHITVFVCGFPLQVNGPVPAHPDFVPDDVDPTLLEAQVAAVRGTRLEPFDLQIGGVNAFLTAPYLRVSDPSAGIARLRAVLAEPLHGQGAREVRFTRYVPHLTIAHFNAGVATRELAVHLQPLRELEPLTLRVQTVQLVDFCARTAHAPFRVLAEVSFGP